MLRQFFPWLINLVFLVSARTSFSSPLAGLSRISSRTERASFMIVRKTAGLRQAKRPEPAIVADAADNAYSRGERIELSAVDLKLLDRLLNHGSLNLTFAGQFMEGRQGDEARVYFEKVAEGGTGLTPAKSIGAERGYAPWHPSADQVRQRLQVVGCGNENARRIGHALGYVRHARFLSGMQKIPALRLDSVAVQRLVTRNAP